LAGLSVSDRWIFGRLGPFGATLIEGKENLELIGNVDFEESILRITGPSRFRDGSTDSRLARVVVVSNCELLSVMDLDIEFLELKFQSVADGLGVIELGLLIAGGETCVELTEFSFLNSSNHPHGSSDSIGNNH